MLETITKTFYLFLHLISMGATGKNELKTRKRMNIGRNCPDLTVFNGYWYA